MIRPLRRDLTSRPRISASETEPGVGNTLTEPGVGNTLGVPTDRGARSSDWLRPPESTHQHATKLAQALGRVVQDAEDGDALPRGERDQGDAAVESRFGGFRLG